MNAELKKYDTIEINDFICVWYHSSGEKPNWFPEKSDAIERKCNTVTELSVWRKTKQVYLRLTSRQTLSMLVSLIINLY